MARSLSDGKLLATLANNAANIIIRRNCSSSQGMVLNAVRGNRGVPEQVEEKTVKEVGNRAWMPDPVTGHYLPEDRVRQIDAAEMRETLLNQRTRASGQV